MNKSRDNRSEFRKALVEVMAEAARGAVTGASFGRGPSSVPLAAAGAAIGGSLEAVNQFADTDVGRQSREVRDRIAESTPAYIRAGAEAASSAVVGVAAFTVADIAKVLKTGTVLSRSARVAAGGAAGTLVADAIKNTDRYVANDLASDMEAAARDAVAAATGYITAARDLVTGDAASPLPSQRVPPRSNEGQEPASGPQAAAGSRAAAYLKEATASAAATGGAALRAAREVVAALNPVATAKADPVTRPQAPSPGRPATPNLQAARSKQAAKQAKLNDSNARQLELRQLAEIDAAATRELIVNTSGEVPAARRLDDRSQIRKLLDAGADAVSQTLSRTGQEIARVADVVESEVKRRAILASIPDDYNPVNMAVRAAADYAPQTTFDIGVELVKRFPEDSARRIVGTMAGPEAGRYAAEAVRAARAVGRSVKDTFNAVAGAPAADEARASAVKMKRLQREQREKMLNDQAESVRAVLGLPPQGGPKSNPLLRGLRQGVEDRASRTNPVLRGIRERATSLPPARGNASSNRIKDAVRAQEAQIEKRRALEQKNDARVRGDADGKRAAAARLRAESRVAAAETQNEYMDQWYRTSSTGKRHLVVRRKSIG